MLEKLNRHSFMLELKMPKICVCLSIRTMLVPSRALRLSDDQNCNHHQKYQGEINLNKGFGKLH